MNKNQFNSALKALTRKPRGKDRVLDLKKVALLSQEMKEAMSLYIIRNRGPVVKDLLPSNINVAWLQAMGYTYRFESKGYDFIGLQEHALRARDMDNRAERQAA